MVRLFYIILFCTFAFSKANAEYIYKDNTGRTLNLYYSWTVDPTGLTKLNVQLVNYSNVTWVDIVLNCEVTGSGTMRSAKKEIALDSAVFDYELSKEINDIDIGQIQPKAKLNCSIIQATQGQPTISGARK